MGPTGMVKINFSGGEPFLHDKLLGQMVQFCHQKRVAVSIVSNGSKITERWMREFGQFVDILAISCDSFVHDSNQRIGRRDTAKKGTDTPQYEIAKRVADWCQLYGGATPIVFKMNTVVNTYNCDEDMVEQVRAINPKRWKVFQCLRIDGENSGDDALRSVEPFIITPSQFDAFIARHRAAGLDPVPENNEDMRDSYLILDEKMRFLNCTRGDKRPTDSILDIGVPAALQDSGFDETAFKRRGGEYKFRKEQYEAPLAGTSADCGACATAGDGVADIEDLVL